MIDISFSTTTSAILKQAQNFSDDCAKSVDILALPLRLDYEFLNSDICETQARYLSDTLKYYYHITPKELKHHYKNELKSLRSAISQLDNYLQKGEAIRLWVSNTASDRCGLYWFCDYVKQFENKISLVSCPGYELDLFKAGYSIQNNWSAFSNLEYIADCIKLEKELPKDLIKSYSNLWQHLVKENAQLRIMIDNYIVSVPEDFFDNSLLEFVKSEPLPQRTVLGNFLGKWQSCSVDFLSKRIEVLISKGVIEVAEEKINDEGCYWDRTIKTSNSLQ